MKRFTVMLNEKTIQKIKGEAQHYTPTWFREILEDNLNLFIDELEKARIEEEKQRELERGFNKEYYKYQFGDFDDED